MYNNLVSLGVARLGQVGLGLVRPGEARTEYPNRYSVRII